jgi:riboflavin transporter FmnP
LHKCLVFSALLMGFHLVERMIVGIASGKSVSESFAGIGGGTLRSTLSMSVLAFVMLIPFFAFREVGRMIGEQKLVSLFLGTEVHVDVGKPDRELQSRDERR